jgi:hypothetical protein
MFDPEDFEVPLERQLKLRLVIDEIDGCTDIKILKESLKQTAEQLMKYQHLLQVTLQKQLMKEVESWSHKIEEELKAKADGTTTD